SEDVTAPFSLNGTQFADRALARDLPCLKMKLRCPWKSLFIRWPDLPAVLGDLVLDNRMCTT
ncbi:MAG: hypothetical protein ACKVG0_14440, partial [Alphaproteobacteria bacterium]